MIFQKLIIKEVLRLITKKFNLNSVQKYVEQPNELDIGFQEIKKEIIEIKADIQLLKQLYMKEK
mgnify:CR=1 FL=1|jgi:hypothetical protein|tara:strand:- start:236 stop:427 length:192 start_codon:yes stop_codon:yes gene_type:complete